MSELRMAGCRDCQAITSGDCGKHGPLVVGSITFNPPPVVSEPATRSFPAWGIATELARIREIVRQREEAMWQAIEECPVSRMERFLGADLLTVVREQVSQCLRYQARAEKAEAALSASRAVVPPEGLRQLGDHWRATARLMADTSRAYEQANTLMQCADELDALLSALYPPQDPPEPAR